MFLAWCAVGAGCHNGAPKPIPVGPSGSFDTPALPNRIPWPPDVSPEQALRGRLGIPADARRVVIFGQAAHLDIDWQKTFDGYYQAYVQDILLEARGILDAQPRAFYSVAEMGYLQHHFALHPEEQVALAAHADVGAFHVVGGGMTSPDTVLPET
jgi:hypothetical protein